MVIAARFVQVLTQAGQWNAPGALFHKNEAPITSTWWSPPTNQLAGISDTPDILDT